MFGWSVLLWAGARAAVTDTGSTGDTGTPTVTTTGETGDTGPGDTGLDVDLDGDGYTPRDGDCDDANAELRPGLPEVCFDQLDNDCDGLSDYQCDDSARLATLEGGGGCTGGANPGTTALVVLLPFALGWRRRA
jgi:hypothetical protein